MGRVKVSLMLEAEVVKSALALRLDISRLAEAAIGEAVTVERNRLWRAQNRDAIAGYADEVDGAGLPLTQYRSF